MTLEPERGQLSADAGRDILKAAVIDRYWRPGRMAVALIRGFGLKRGAVATSTGWDCGHIVAVGADDADLAFCVNRIRALQGGTVVIAGGKVLAELALPAAGTFSEEPMEVVAQRYAAVQQAAEGLGTKLPDVRMSLQVLTTPSIPFFRICEEGLFDLKMNRLVLLEVV